MPGGGDPRQPPVPPERQLPQMVDEAADLTRYILAADPERLRHSEAVARRAEFLTLAVTSDQAPFLVAVAWLHDIGNAPGLRQTGFHPIDGALHLRSAGWPDAMCDLVAHHSGSRFVAAARHMEAELALFGHQDDALTDALTVADQTAGPRGRPMTVDERVADMLARHGPDSPNAQAHRVRGAYLRATARRVADRLEAVGIDPAEHRIF